MGLQQDEEFDSFCKTILPCVCQNGLLFCGSFYEQPVEYVMSNLTDLDQMFFPRKCIAVTDTTVISKHFHGEILTIETINCHLGFARLLRRRDGKTEYFTLRYTPRKGPSYPYRLLTWIEVSDIARVILNYIPSLKAFEELTVDNVGSVLCLGWPSEALEWKTRRRYYGWPSGDMIDKIVRGGCHLVPKSHESNPNDAVSWRYSFSQAELILNDAWNEVQKYIYHILRIIKSDVVKKCGAQKKTFLCTYYFKTLMMWACEEKPSSFWSEDRIEEAIEELLLQMIQWLIDRNCRNYFIRENNMIDHLQSDFDVTNEVLLLNDARLDIPTVVAREPMAYRGKMFHCQISHKALLLLQLALNRRVFFNVMNHTRERYVVKNLSSSALLRREVEYLFRAVQLHLLLMSDMSSSEAEICEKRKSWATEALGCFQKSCERKVTDNYIDVFISLLDSLSHNVNKFLNGTRGEHSQRMCCYRRSDKSNFTTEAKEALCRAMISTMDNNHHNLSFFISAAYYANFYYTGLQDCRQALKICEVALESIRSYTIVRPISLDTFEHFFSNEILCVFINRRYLDIFDAGIQVVFGFLTLCLTTIRQIQVWYPRVQVTDFVFQVCPVEFLEYIRIRCRNKLHLCKVDRVVDKSLFPAVETDDNRTMSNAILFAAISVYYDILS